MMKNLQYLTAIICFLLLICTESAAQEHPVLKGKVTDSNTGETIYGPGINIKDTGLWTVTDNNGEFQFDGIQPGDYSIAVACL